MAKPGRREHKLSKELDRFTNRVEEFAAFRQYLNSATEPSVLMFYGIGGAGKTWLLKKLRQEMPADLPSAILDFDIAAGGHRFVLDPATALYEIRHQLGMTATRFDLAFATLRHKQGAVEGPAFAGETAAGTALQLSVSLVQAVHGMVPGAGVLLNKLNRPLLDRLRGTHLERFLADVSGGSFILELRTKTSQEISDELLDYFATDLRESLPAHFNRAIRAVVFLDTFEAISSGIRNTEHQRAREQWVRNLAAKFDSCLVVIAGQNRLTWDEAEPDWADNLDQRMLGGLSETDARQFLKDCSIENVALQDSILAAAHDLNGGGYHCFSLGLCADIVFAERRGNQQDPKPEQLGFRPQDWEAVARRFLKCLNSDVERRWIEKLALTPRFDRTAGCSAFSMEASAAQEAEWDSLHDYSFVYPLSEMPDWSAIRLPMRRAIENQPSARLRAGKDHEWWREYWSARSHSTVDDSASLAWYHHYCLRSDEALAEWLRLAKDARSSVPSRMQEHFRLLGWWDAVELLEATRLRADIAQSCVTLGEELLRTSLGNGTSALRLAIAYSEHALRVYNEHNYPRDWAKAQNSLGRAWQHLPTGNRSQNLNTAIAHFECALQVYNEQEFPRDWANVQNSLGLVWWTLPTGDLATNLGKAKAYFESALRVRTECDFPKDWAMTQNNLGLVWASLPTGSKNANLRHAKACFEAALRGRTERDSPPEWAMIQNNVGQVWSNLPTGDRARNLKKTMGCCEAALRVYSEQDFPQDWARVQNNLGVAWANLPTGDRPANLRRAIEYYEASLRVYKEQDFPQEWARAQNNLGVAWTHFPTGDRAAHLSHAKTCFESALRVRTEADFPQDWAMIHNNLGFVWSTIPTGDPAQSLSRAIASYEAALRVYSEEKFPQEWARTNNNLGVAWKNLVTGDRTANLQRAKSHFDLALRVRTEQDYPKDWAATQNDLGLVWWKFPSGHHAENLRRAIVCFEFALRVHTERDFPQEWASTQHNLGLVWSEFPTGNRNENLVRAIVCYESALRVRTEKSSPQNWAMTQNSLGLAWSRLPIGDRTENVQTAISCYESALRVRTERDSPRDWAHTQHNLALAWWHLPTGDRAINLQRSMACFELALRVLTGGLSLKTGRLLRTTLGSPG